MLARRKEVLTVDALDGSEGRKQSFEFQRLSLEQENEFARILRRDLINQHKEMMGAQASITLQDFTESVGGNACRLSGTMGNKAVMIPGSPAAALFLKLAYVGEVTGLDGMQTTTPGKLTDEVASYLIAEHPWDCLGIIIKLHPFRDQLIKKITTDPDMAEFRELLPNL